MPQLKVSQHEFIFKSILLHKELSILELQYADILDFISYEGLNKTTFDTVNKQPAIFCTFHMGSNRVINHFLASNKISYSLVIADHITKAEGEDFKKMFRECQQEELNIISAQLPNAGFKMLRELKKGKSLLVYIDGNTGSGDDTIKNTNRCKIDFLNQSIYARKGVSYLSHLANVPIIPVICYRKSIEDIRLKFFNPIFPDVYMERELFSKNNTQKLYDLFIPILERFPEQWECWIYLHTIINSKEFGLNENKTTEMFVLNKGKFGFFNIDTELFLFDKQTYNSYPIDQPTYNLLFKAATQAIESNELSNNLFQQFYDNKVLIKEDNALHT